MAPPAGTATFERLEVLGEKAFEFHDVPDAGLWSFRTEARVRVRYSVMCWAACDRVGRIAHRPGSAEREAHQPGRADSIRSLIEKHAWNGSLRICSTSSDGDDIEASLPLLHGFGWFGAGVPASAAQSRAVPERREDGAFVFRHESPGDVRRAPGLPQPPRLAVRAHQSYNRGAPGQLSADLQ